MAAKRKLIRKPLKKQDSSSDGESDTSSVSAASVAEPAPVPEPEPVRVEPGPVETVPVPVEAPVTLPGPDPPVGGADVKKKRAMTPARMESLRKATEARQAKRQEQKVSNTDLEQRLYERLSKLIQPRPTKKKKKLVTIVEESEDSDEEESEVEESPPPRRVKKSVKNHYQPQTFPPQVGMYRSIFR